MKGMRSQLPQLEHTMLTTVSLQHSFSLEASALGYGHWYALSQRDTTTIELSNRFSSEHVS
jgi:hypothetical protein